MTYVRPPGGDTSTRLGAIEKSLEDLDLEDGQGSVGDTYTLASDSAIGATTITLDRMAVGMLAGGTYIAVGALTTKCEIRKVNAIAGATLTLFTALNLTHTTADNVWVLSDTWVTPEWFGCKSDDATVDNYLGFMQAFIDGAGGARFGLTGHTARYYVGTPICIYDETRLEKISFTQKSTFSIDPLIGKRLNTTTGIMEPDQFFATLGGQFGTITAVDTATNVITLSTSAGTALGERLIFYPRQGNTLPAPVEAGRTYYVKTTPGTNQYTISIDRDGAELDITSVNVGSCVFFSTGAARMDWNQVMFEGIDAAGLNGLIAYVQQPSVAHRLRCNSFAGPKGCALIGGQQADFYTPMFVGGRIGLNLQSGQFIYLFGANYELCDLPMQCDNTDMYGGVAGNSNIENFGSHWETPGQYSATIQTLVGNAAVSAGTFTLTFGGQTTAGIAYNASAATVQAALEALSTVEPVDILCTDEAGGLPAGRVRCTFKGQYEWKRMSGTNRITVTSTGLTGGVYAVSYIHPDAKSISIKTGGGISVWGGRVSAGTKPDGAGSDFLVLESAATTTGGYLVQGVTSVGQGGYAVNDIPRGITVPWADAAGGASERLAYFSAGGYHGGTVAKNWWLAGRLGGHMVWDEYQEEFRVNGTAKVRFGDTGPIIRQGTETPEGVVTAPVGSLFLRTDAATSLYVKQTGTGNTGWVAK